MSTGLQPCRTCGHLLQDQARFCQLCGAKQEAAIGEPSAAKIVISFLILIIGVPGSLIAAAVSGSFGACVVQGVSSAPGSSAESNAAFARTAIAIGVAVFLLCMVVINQVLKSLKR